MLQVSLLRNLAWTGILIVTSRGHLMSYFIHNSVDFLSLIFLLFLHVIPRYLDVKLLCITLFLLSIVSFARLLLLRCLRATI